MLQLQHVSSEGTELNIIRQLFKEYEQELDADLCFQSFDAELANPLNKYGQPHGSLILAYWSNEAAGCIALQPLTAAGCCEMKRLFVRPSFRKHAIGEALVVQLLKDAVQLGYATMKLDTLQRLQPAIKLYQKHGFQLTQAYYDNPLNEVVYMQKQIQ